MFPAFQLFLKSKRKAVSELEALCALVQERNQLIGQEIRATDKSSVLCADELLDRHEKLGVCVYACMSEKKYCQILCI